MANEKAARPDKLMINILGVDHELVYTWWALSQFKKLTGVNVFAATGGLDASDPFQLISLVWAGLITKKPDYDFWFLVDGQPPEKLQKLLQLIGKEIVGERVHEISEIVGQAIDIAMPKMKNKKK